MSGFGVHPAGTAWLGLVILMGGGGCAGMGSGSGMAAGRTGGITLEMRIEREGGSVVQYRVRRDGWFEFAGGLDARIGKISWTGEMTDEEIGRMHELLEEMDWLNITPESTHQPAELEYRIKCAGSWGRISMKVEGENSRVRPMQDFLSKIAERRLDEFMEGLPKAGVQKR